ncbi:MAG: hypothetical protein ABUS48_01795 [Pseudomonadota bacterium]
MAFDAADLSPHEQYVIDRTREGEVADFTPMAGAGRPVVRAGFLRKLLLQLDPDWPVRLPGVRIKGARIEGVLDLSDCAGAAGLPALELIGCEIPEPMDFRHARLARLSLSESAFTHLLAQALTLDGPLDFRRAHGLGEDGVCWIDARAATIRGRVDGDEARLRLPDDAKGDGNSQPYALVLRESKISGGVCLRPNFAAKGGVTLFDAVVEGLVDMRGAYLNTKERRALNLGNLRVSGVVSLNRGFRCDGSIWMRGAVLDGGVNLDGATIHTTDNNEGINGDSCECGEDLQLRNRFSCNAPVSFVGALVRGSVRIDKGGFSAEGVALDLSKAEIEGELAGAAVIQGSLGIAGVQIGRNLDLRGAEITSPHKKDGANHASEYALAIDAVGIRVGGAALLQGANVRGEIFMADARIEGYLAFGGGRFMNAGGWAVRAPNARIGGNLTLKLLDDEAAPHGRKTVIQGGAKFDRALIDGAVSWLNLELRGPGPDNARGPVLSLADARIQGALEARHLTAQEEARIDLSGASCGSLDDDLKTGWGMEKATLGLEGFDYQRLDGGGRDDRWRARLNWLRRSRGEIFSPQPYATLAQVYARAGLRDDARRVLLAQHDLRTAYAPAGPLTRVFSSLFGLIAGYGLAPIRAARALAIFLVIGIVGVFAMDATGALVTPQGAPCAGAVEPALYAIDVAVPVIDLGQQSKCAPGRAPGSDLFRGVAVQGTDWRLFEGVALWRWAQSLYALLGALLTALAVITFSGVMKPKSDD